MTTMTARKLTTILIVDSIEDSLPSWEKLGYEVTVRVPEEGRAGFVILSGNAGELMLQTRESVADDLPIIAKKRPAFVLYADVPSLATAKKAFRGATVLVPRRKTFYGAVESWLELSDGVILGLSEHPD